MRHNIRFLLIVTTLFLMAGIGVAQEFVHPGIDMNQADLKYMRKQVQEGKQPWKDAYDLLKEKTSLDFQVKPFAHVISGPYAKPDIGGKDLSQSARMAYSCAVLWYISREDRYAEMVVDIIEKWANTLRSFDENNAKLLVALTGYEFCNAAEILRYNYPGWKEKDTENMTRLMMSAFYPTIRYYFPVANGNWDGAIMHTLLAIAVFTDNRELFDNAVYHYLHSNANGSLIKYIYPTGQCQETRRDQGHVQMGLYEFSGAARIAYTQGVDLFNAADNRLALGLEYSARFITGDSVYAYGVPSQRERFKYRSGFEYCIDHFTAKGINMPYLKELCGRTEMNNPANALWKLTAFRDAFRQKPSDLMDIPESMVAYHAGATLEQNRPMNRSIIEINERDDLQAVLNANAGTGKTVFLRAGEYKLKQSLTIPSGIHICGEGRSTVLICEPTVRTAAILLGDLDAENIIIENLVVDGAQEHQEAYDPNSGRFYRTGRYSNALAGISLRGETGHAFCKIKLKDLTVINFSRSGVYISDAEGVEIDHCDFTENGAHVVPGPRLQHNLMIQHSSQITIKDSRFDTSIRGCGLVFDHCKSLRVENCEVARNGWHGVLMAECHNCEITHCLIEGNDGCGFMGEYLHGGSTRIRIKQNTIQYNNSYGIQTFAMKETDIKDNLYRWNGKEEQQECLSSEKKLQLEQLSE